MYIALLVLSWFPIISIILLADYSSTIPENEQANKSTHITSLFNSEYIDNLDRMNFSDLNKVLRLQDKLSSLSSRYTISLEKYQSEKDRLERKQGSIYFLAIGCIIALGGCVVNIKKYNWWMYAIIFFSWLIIIFIVPLILKKIVKLSHFLHNFFDNIFIKERQFIPCIVKEQPFLEEPVIVNNTSYTEAFIKSFTNYYDEIESTIHAKICLLEAYSVWFEAKAKVSVVLLVMFISFVILSW